MCVAVIWTMAQDRFWTNEESCCVFESCCVKMGAPPRVPQPAEHQDLVSAPERPPTLLGVAAAHRAGTRGAGGVAARTAPRWISTGGGATTAPVTALCA